MVLKCKEATEQLWLPVFVIPIILSSQLQIIIKWLLRNATKRKFLESMKHTQK